ncbi:Aristolochene synthase in complex with 12,13 Difluorofarnesyl diphosphate [Elsinoe ampelina]|uniref:Aristolochene synthase in complex with 12,13 Difluorofarnesyl diphosphate n=1 Tax=Elsinoe ampelina TaxID=302913 RepID=A0A6A6G0U9_9PEZI|nr:Aristolochene synthase in complex with 12,13 Difluorofarnesyl diphosphate [Elsinoe ampelina]
MAVVTSHTLDRRFLVRVTDHTNRATVRTKQLSKCDSNGVCIDRTAVIHPNAVEVAGQVDGDFIRDWDFPSEKAVMKFLAAGSSRVTCLYFPMARDDRLHWACRVLTILFLIDDLLEDMSFENGLAYNNKLMPIMRGDVLPDRTCPVEWIMYDLWEGIRACNRELADNVLEPTFLFMRSQTDRDLSVLKNLGQYLEHREKDVGKALLSALMCFAMDLHRNDICGWEKGVLAASKGHAEGGVLCSAVQILANETELTVPATKRVLWAMVRGWSERHDQLVSTIEKVGYSGNVARYLKGLEYQMIGHEDWSLSTQRYTDVEDANAF